MSDEELIQLARARYESGLAPSYEQTEAIFRAMDERDELRKQVELLRAGMANALDQRDALERK